MIAGIHDLSAEQDCEYTVGFHYYDAEDVAVGILTDYDNVRFVVRKSSLPQDNHLFEIVYDDSQTEGYLPFPLTETYGTITIVNEKITIAVSTETMTSVYPGNYFYYVFLETNTGVSDCLVRGKFTVEAP